MYKIAIFASGNGTNAENIAKHFQDSDLARVTLVLTNVRNAGVVARMAALGIDTYYVPNEKWTTAPQQIASFLASQGIDLVVLAGFMRKVDDRLVESFRGRMLNIHPSLLPAYGGKGMYGHHVHEAVIAAGEQQSGVTVHQVSEVMDGGDIVEQESVDILPGETPQSLEEKIHQIEYSIYPRAIEKVLAAMPTEPQADSQTEPQTAAEESAPQSCAEQWAGALGMKDYSDAEAQRRLDAATPPAMPSATPPAMPQSTPPATPPSAPSCTPPQAPVAAEASVAAEMPTQSQAATACQPERPEMPSTYLLWSVLCIIFCCTIPAIVAVVFSCQVSSKYYRDDFEGAERASKRAQAWILVSFVLGVLQATIVTPLYMLLS